MRRLGIRPAEGGYIVNVCNEGGKGEYEDKDHIAKTEDEALAIARKAMTQKGRKGRRVSGGESEPSPSVSYGKSPRKKARKRGASKR